MSDTANATSDSHSHPALGARENFWGDDDENDAGDDDALETGHGPSISGTDPAAYVAHQLALRVVQPICGETGRLLSEPTLYLPKQADFEDSRTVEYCQHRHRRRYEPESGRINWGETTSTEIPEFDYDTYRLCVHTYLAERGCRLTAVDDYLEYAECVWRDPQFGSKDALEQFIRHVRDREEE